MFVHNIELNNFRNYENLRINFPTKKIILVGKNAQGKSNLLEAIYYIASLSSNRGASDSEIIQNGKSLSKIKSEITKYDTNITLDVIINPPKQKLIKVNDIKKSKYSDFLGNLIVVNFGISDLSLLRGTPGDRRNWLDSAISQLYPAYVDRLSRFNKIKTQRNNLLKEFKGNINISGSQKDYLSVWNDQLITTGSNLIYLRLKYLKEIQKIACKKHNHISVGEEVLLIKYISTVLEEFNTETDEIVSINKISEFYKNRLDDRRNEEIIRAQTLIGPHRDDINFFINGIEAKNFASQGQQRTIVLALKLAELDFIKEIIDETPVLLLDDVLAELDQSRQNYLLDAIKDDIQTIITTVDISNFEPDYLKDVTIYNIKSGTVV